MGFSKELYHQEGMTNPRLSAKSRTEVRKASRKLPTQSGPHHQKSSANRQTKIFFGGHFERLKSALMYRIENIRSHVFDKKNMLKAAIIAALYLIIVRPNAPQTETILDQNSSYALNVAETSPSALVPRIQESEVEKLMPEPTRIADPVISAAKHAESASKFEKTTVDKKSQIAKNANPHAPVGHKSLMADEVKAYIERFAPIAIAEMKKFGVPASISLAQGLVESRAGTSKLAVSNNNHFGIKCFSKN